MEHIEKKNAQFNSLQLSKCKAKLECMALMLVEFEEKLTNDDFQEAWQDTPNYSEQNSEVTESIADLELDVSNMLLEVQQMIDIIIF